MFFLEKRTTKSIEYGVQKGVEDGIQKGVEDGVRIFYFYNLFIDINIAFHIVAVSIFYT
jgi:flagellar biosynthesis/type III secretory pathway protein FliH